ncbi:MAG: thiamine phosphate synthase [Gammaproteobacteria bacterium]|nr:thiamine phosphate synthase [Gammaproteobacteria bacterium]
MNPLPTRGLYAVTPELEAVAQMEPLVEAALKGGAKMVQFRDKSTDDAAREEAARTLQALCNRFAAPLIINDDVELARVVGADGIHLGKDDMSPAQARAILGSQSIIGVSCYNDATVAANAIADGADYVAYGSFYPSPTKPDAVRASVDLVAATRPSLTVPLVGIGGITVENAPALISAGVDLLAVITAVFGTDNPSEAAQQFDRLFQ